ncbi:hypothetical protein EsH8_XI_000068 [Colletotrichum jinshuiense]
MNNNNNNNNNNTAKTAGADTSNSHDRHHQHRRRQKDNDVDITRISQKIIRQRLAEIRTAASVSTSQQPIQAQNQRPLHGPQTGSDSVLGGSRRAAVVAAGAATGAAETYGTVAPLNRPSNRQTYHAPIQVNQTNNDTTINITNNAHGLADAARPHHSGHHHPPSDMCSSPSIVQRSSWARHLIESTCSAVTAACCLLASLAWSVLWSLGARLTLLCVAFAVFVSWMANAWPWVTRLVTAISRPFTAGLALLSLVGMFPTFFESPSPPRGSAVASTAGDGSTPTSFMPELTFLSADAVKSVMGDLLSTGEWLRGFADHDLGPVTLAGLSLADVDFFSDGAIYDAIVDLELMANSYFLTSLSSTLRQVATHADELKTFPTKLFLPPALWSRSGAVAFLACLPRNALDRVLRRRAPRHLGILRSRARVAAAGSVLDAARQDIVRVTAALTSGPLEGEMARDVCQWASRFRPIAALFKRFVSLPATGRPEADASAAADAPSAFWDGDGDEGGAGAVLSDEERRTARIALQCVQSSQNEADYLCALLKGDTAARFDERKRRLRKYKERLGDWLKRTHGLEALLDDEVVPKTQQSLEVVIDEIDAKLVRIYDEVEGFLRQTFSA